MGRFEKGALSTIVYLAIVMMAVMIPKLAVLYYMASWFGVLIGAIAFGAGLKHNCRLRAYLGGTAIMNFTVAMGLAYTLMPLAIAALVGCVICIFMASRAQKGGNPPI